MAKPFAGFPDGPLDATVVPSLFVTEALGSIDDLGELKLILYLFWRFGQKRAAPRFLSRSELEADRVIAAGLSSGPVPGLAAALDRLVADRIVLRLTLELAGKPDEVYLINSAKGRRTLADLVSGKIDIGQIAAPPEQLRPDQRPSIFHLYEQNVGMLTPLIVDELTAAEQDFPGEWIEDGFREAVRNNRRSWAYVHRILQRWAVEGKSDEASGGRASRQRRSSTVGGGR